MGAWLAGWLAWLACWLGWLACWLDFFLVGIGARAGVAGLSEDYVLRISMICKHVNHGTFCRIGV